MTTTTELRYYTAVNGLKSWTALIKGGHKNKMAVDGGQYRIGGRHKKRTTMSERPFAPDNRPPPPTFPRDQFFSASHRRRGRIHKKIIIKIITNNDDDFVVSSLFPDPDQRAIQCMRVCVHDALLL